jgi:hypothetical protein
LFFVLSSDSVDIPDTEETKTAWYCTETNQGFELTAKQMADMVQQRRVEDAGDSDSGPQMRRPGSTTIEVAKSPFTNDWTGVAARKCGDCGTIFPAKAKDGEVNICPKCKWDPMTGRKAEGDRAYIGE